MEDTAYEDLMDIINEIYAQEPIELGCGEINCFLCAKGGRLKPCDRLREAVILLLGENRLLTLLNRRAFPEMNVNGFSIGFNCPVIPPWDFTKRWVENWRSIWEKAPLEWFKFYSNVPTNPLKPMAIFRAEEKDD